MASGYLPNPVSSGELIAELSARAPKVGANTGVWPGLTIYRFTSPVGPTWEEIQSLSLCIVAQGRKSGDARRRDLYIRPVPLPGAG